MVDELDDEDVEPVDADDGADDQEPPSAYRRVGPGRPPKVPPASTAPSRGSWWVGKSRREFADAQATHQADIAKSPEGRKPPRDWKSDL